MSKNKKTSKFFQNAEHFELVQRATDLAKAIAYWPKSILIGRREEELKEVEEKLKKYDVD